MGTNARMAWKPPGFCLEACDGLALGREAGDGVMAGAEIHPVTQHHASLYADSDVKMRLKLELTRATSA